MRLRSFHMRLLAWSLALLFVAMAAVFWLTSRGLEAEVVRETRERALRELEAVQWLMHEHGAFGSRERFQEWVAGLGAKLGIRITYVVDGRVMADSSVPLEGLADLEDHSGRPEILAAELGAPGMDERMSSTLGRRMIYVARATNMVEGVGRGVLRLAVPFTTVQDVVGRLRAQAGIVIAFILLAAVLVAYWLSRSLTRSIKEFSDLAGTIGQGGYSKRIRSFPGGEFAPLAEAVNLMAERIEADVAFIREQSGRFKAVFEGVRDGIVVLDREGRVVSHNPAALAIYPDLGRLEECRFLEVARDMDIQVWVEDLLRRESGPDAPDRGLAARIGERHYQVTAVPIEDESGVRRMVLAYHDVTGIKRNQKILEDFVANVSHQLRTPLTSIKGYVETLLDSPPKDPEQARSFLSIVLANADHLGRVVSSMLALASSERAGSGNALGAVDAAKLVGMAVGELSWQARQKQVEVVAETPESGPVVRATMDGLLQVLRNLIENAVEYGPAGGVVRIRVTSGGGEAVFRVSDQGPGIPKKYRERVFDRFFRLDPNTVEARGNAGLGLAICRQIVENFGGGIHVDEPEGDEGAVFVFTLRLDPGKSPDTPEE